MDKNNIMIGTWAWGTGARGSSIVFGKKQDPAVLKQSFAKAVESGFLRWDTAAVYGMGTCETLLGELIQNHDNIFISTKFMPDKKYKSGALVQSFEDSMKRLQRNNADLFWIHVPHHLAENLQDAIPLMKSGKIRSLGISNVSLAHIQEAEKMLAKEELKLSAVQNHFSLLRNDQQPIIDYCNARNIQYYAYMVLEQGALSGRYDASHHFPLLSMRNFAFPKSKFRRIEGLLAKMREMANKYHIDCSQIPILWVMGKGAIPIVGITKPSHAEKLAEAMKITLTPEELSALEQEAAATGLRQQGIWEPQ